jgi:hypothetical protein
MVINGDDHSIILPEMHSGLPGHDKKKGQVTLPFLTLIDGA